MNSFFQSSLDDFLSYLEQIHPLSNALKKTLAERITYDCLPPRSLILEEGEICDRVYYMERGLARGYYLVDGKEMTAWFTHEGDWMVSVSSFFDQKPSVEFIELLEETALLSIHFEDLNQIYRQFPEFNFIGRFLTERYYGLSEQRSWSLRHQTTMERYHHLLKTHPQLLERAPLKYIASYLGMKPETLSRLRTKETKKMMLAERLDFSIVQYPRK